MCSSSEGDKVVAALDEQYWSEELDDIGVTVDMIQYAALLGPRS